ncbi:MAG: 5-formyltetrahydrofolate cyclo-ligase [Thiotrichales bacterium]|nr:5-formyltetrahydrofolate cyclo-ligase [Thiotrichales bacterium]
MSAPSTELRNQLRAKRRQLSMASQQHNQNQACTHFLHHLDHHPEVAKIAVFLSQDGELGTEQLIEQLWKHPGISVYLPILVGQQMQFSLYHPQTSLKLNRFGIPEPQHSEICAPPQLDWVLTPLVGFDLAGNRIGMGGGFYDRTFAFKQKRQSEKTPLLIGWAHSCQQLESIEARAWDLPLDLLITEQGLLNFRR